MTTLRYGIVGGGFVAAFQLRAMAQVRGLEVVGFVSKDPVDHLVPHAGRILVFFQCRQVGAIGFEDCSVLFRILGYGAE